MDDSRVPQSVTAPANLTPSSPRVSLLGGGASEMPSTSQSFFWAPTINSARRARSSALANAFRSSSFSRASSDFGLGPRFFAFRPPRPSSRLARRHWHRCEEYRPSRRRIAPTWPGSVALSHSSRIFALYAAVKRRRFGLAVTSGSGASLGVDFDNGLLSLRPAQCS